MSYQVPTHEMLFVLNELAALPEILEQPGFEEITPDLIEAILQEKARFVEQEVAPLNRVGDTRPPVCENGVVTTSPGFQAAFQAFAQAGWQGLNHAVELGGQGLPKAVAACTTESMNSANLSFSLCPLLSDGVIEALSMVGSDEQKQRYIGPMVEGRWTGTMNLTEPQAGSDLAQVATRAIPQDDGNYRISGRKIFITYGEHDMAENIVHLVLARLPDAPQGVKGLSLFLVPKYVVNADGSLGARNDVWCATLEDKLGIHGSPTAELLYGDNKGEVGEGAIGELVGDENEGLKLMFIMMNAARFAVGIQGVGVSEAACQQATAFAHERVQGQALVDPDKPVTIAHHPDVQRLLLTMRALTDGGRALACMAAGCADLSAVHPDAGVRQQQRARYEFLVPVVKGFCTEISVEVASMGLQVHGGMGYIEETGVAQYYRDARILPIYEGTTAIQANDMLARKLLRDGGQTAQALLADMQATLARLKEAVGQDQDGDTGLMLVAEQFERALGAWETAAVFLLRSAQKSLPATFLGSVPWLMLAGITLAGWQMTRAALACVRYRNEGEETEFHQKKMATCVAYATWVLPRTSSLAASIVAAPAAIAYSDQV